MNEEDLPESNINSLKDFYKNANLSDSDLAAYAKKLRDDPAFSKKIKQESQEQRIQAENMLNLAKQMLEHGVLNPQHRKTRISMKRVSGTPSDKHGETLRERLADIEEAQNQSSTPSKMKAKVYEVGELKGAFLEDHPDSPVINFLKIKQKMESNSCASGAEVKLIFVRASTGGMKDFGRVPLTTTDDPFSTSEDLKRTRTLPMFYGVSTEEAMPKVGSIVKVEYLDKLDSNSGVILEIHATPPTPPKTYGGKSSFKGAGSTPLGQ